MNDPVEALVRDLLQWVAQRPRPYAEVMEAWRTSCPRLPVWEEANSRGFIARSHDAEAGEVVGLTAAGRAHIERP
jgi:D-3-phosphoglycerate dehydrogenase / 2-oxoglutarate reductase